MSDDSVNEYYVSEYLGVSIYTVRKWRSRKRGPNYYKYEGCVRYEKAELEEYKRSRTVRHTTQQ